MLEPLETFAVVTHGSYVFLEDDLLSGRGTDDFREPPQVGRAPICPACVADVVSKQEGFETQLGVFAIADGIFTCPGKITNGFIFYVGDIDRGEIA